MKNLNKTFSHKENVTKRENPILTNNYKEIKR